MTSRARSKVHAVWIAALILGSSARAWSDEPLAREPAGKPVYVVTEDRVRVISENELPLLRAHPCKPAVDPALTARSRTNS